MLILLLGCFADITPTCSSDRGCTDGAACVNEICQGRVCSVDGDCPTGEVCASVLGSETCARPCEADGDCYGESACLEVPETGASDAEAARYCF